jgi:uncharacterized membrane protein
VVRVSIQWTDFDRMVDAGFEQIRLYSQTDMAVSLRLLRALGDIAVGTPDEQYRRTLAERGRRIVSGCAQRLGELELREMRVRLASLESFVAPPSLEFEHKKVSS